MLILSIVALLLSFPVSLFVVFLYYIGDSATKLHVIGALGPLAFLFPLSFILLTVTLLKRRFKTN